MSSRCTSPNPPRNPLRLSNLPARFFFALVALGTAAGCHRARGRAPVDRSTFAPNVVGGVGFAEPAAVLHDPDFDRYYVANLNGSPEAADDNGFISMVSAAGDTMGLKWIDGASKDVTLGAPKGMAVVGPFLYVTDISTIRRFDRRSGAPQGDIPVPGAVSLDDMDSGFDGTLYFTDSGDSARAGAVYRLGQDGKLDTLARGAELGHPTGIAITGDSVWVVSREGEMYRLAEGKRVDVTKLPSAGLEGLVVFGGNAFVSTTVGRAVLRGRLGGPFTALLPDVDAEGGIGYDLWRNRVLVPLAASNELRIVRLAF